MTTTIQEKLLEVALPFQVSLVVRVPVERPRLWTFWTDRVFSPDGAHISKFSVMFITTNIIYKVITKVRWYNLCT